MPSITAGIMAGAALGGAALQGSAAKSAAKTQANAATYAADLQMQMFQQMQGNLAPYMLTGQNALTNLSMLTGNAPTASPQIAQLQQQLQAAQSALAALPAAPATTGAGGLRGVIGGVANAITGTPSGTGGPANLGLVQSPVAGSTNQPYAAAGGGTPGQLPGDRAGLESLISNLQSQINQAQFSSTPGNPLTAPLTRPFQPTMQELENTPGYQFTLNQGLRAAQNAATSMGLGQSGPAIAGAADYASGLASTTYQQQFQNYWANNMNLYNMVAGLATMGQNAAAGVGTAGIQAGSNAGNALMGGANALAAGTVGAANAWSGGIQGAGNNAMMLAMMKNNGLFGSQTPPPVATPTADGGWNPGPGGFPMPDTGGF